MKDNWWIEIKSPTVKGKKYRTIAFCGTQEQAIEYAKNEKTKYIEKGHVNVSVKIFKVDDMFLVESF